RKQKGTQRNSPRDEMVRRCNDGTFNCFHHGRAWSPRRLLGLGLSPLEGRLLPAGPAAEALVLPLCVAVRHGRDQRELLSAAAAFNLPRLARQGAARVSLRRQGQPL